jgi:hypothetical protein
MPRPARQLRWRVGVAVWALLGGELGELLGLRETAVVAAPGAVVAFLWLALSPVRALRELPKGPEQPEGPGDETAADAPAPEALSGPLLDAPAARRPVAGGL